MLSWVIQSYLNLERVCAWTAVLIFSLFEDMNVFFSLDENLEKKINERNVSGMISYTRNIYLSNPKFEGDFRAARFQ